MDLRKKTASGFVYKLLERVGAQGINFIVSLVLARILMPEDYGVIALVTVFIQVCDVFVSYGFGSSLVANKDSDSLDFSTCFYFGGFLSIIVYVIIYFCAPFIAEFYDSEILTSVIRIMGVRIPIAAINSVQQAYVSKHMDFKKFFIATSVGTVISGIIAIVMAYKGFGIWSLVEQYLGNVCIDTLCLAIIVKWHPKFEFSFKRLKKIYSYGWKILFVGLIDTGYTQLKNLVVGKKYTKAELAYMTKGEQIPSVGMGIIESSINGVMFPALSKCNDDIKQMKDLTRRAIKLSSYIIFPFMVGVFAISGPLIITLLTDKWADSVVFCQICCLALIFRPLQFINNSVIKASGRSGLLLTLDILKKTIGVILLFVSLNYGVKWVALSFVFTNLISTIINAIPIKKIINYSIIEQIKDVLSSLVISVIMGVIVYSMTYIPINQIAILVIQIISGIIIYVLLSLLFKVNAFVEIKAQIKTFIKNKKEEKNKVADTKDNNEILSQDESNTENAGNVIDVIDSENHYENEEANINNDTNDSLNEKSNDDNK